MNRQDTLCRVVEGVLAAHLRDYRQGLRQVANAADPEAAKAELVEGLLEMGRRRAPHIRDEFMATLNLSTPICAECTAPGTTRIAGRDWCAIHAATAPRRNPDEVSRG